MASLPCFKIGEMEPSSTLTKGDTDGNGTLINKVFENINILHKMFSSIPHLTKDVDKITKGEDLTKKYHRKIQECKDVLSCAVSVKHEKSLNLAKEVKQEFEHQMDFFRSIETDMSALHKRITDIEKQCASNCSTYQPYEKNVLSGHQEEISKKTDSNDDLLTSLKESAWKMKSQSGQSLVAERRPYHNYLENHTATTKGSADDSIAAKNTMNATYVVDNPLWTNASDSSSSLSTDFSLHSSGEQQSSKSQKGFSQFEYVIPPPVPFRSQSMKDFVKTGQHQQVQVEKPKTGDYKRDLQRVAPICDFEYRKLPQNICERFSLKSLNSHIEEFNKVLRMKELTPGGELLMSPGDIKHAMSSLQGVDLDLVIYVLTKTKRLCDRNAKKEYVDGLYRVRLLCDEF